MNWVDGVIIVIIGWFVWDGWKKGVFWLVAQMLAFVLGLFFAFWGYGLFAGLLTRGFGISHGLAKALGFVGAAIIGEQVIYEVLARMVRAIPRKYFPAWWSGLMSTIPSIVNGAVFVGFIVVAVISLPLRPSLKRGVMDSRLGALLVGRVMGVE